MENKDLEITISLPSLQEADLFLEGFGWLFHVTGAQPDFCLREKTFQTGMILWRLFDDF